MRAERQLLMAGHDLHGLLPGQLASAHRALTGLLRGLAAGWQIRGRTIRMTGTSTTTRAARTPAPARAPGPVPRRCWRWRPRPFPFFIRLPPTSTGQVPPSRSGTGTAVACALGGLVAGPGGLVAIPLGLALWAIIGFAGTLAGASLGHHAHLTGWGIALVAAVVADAAAGLPLTARR